MTRSDEDTLFLCSIPNGVLEEFRAEACFQFTITVFQVDSFLPTQMYSGSFIRKNPMMFVDTTWVKIDNLKEFLREREVKRLYFNFLVN